MAQKREIKVTTIRKSTTAGVAAGHGGAYWWPVRRVPSSVERLVPPVMAAKMAQNVVSLNDLLAATESSERHQVLGIFRECFREEFLESIQNQPELKLILGGGTIFGVMRYMVERDMLHNEQLEKLDRILRKIA